MKRFIEKIGKIEVRASIAVIVLLGSFAFLFRLMKYPVPAQNETLINVIAGAVIVGAIGSVLGYYFGMSKQQTDAKKDDTINQPE